MNIGHLQGQYRKIYVEQQFYDKVEETVNKICSKAWVTSDIEIFLSVQNLKLWHIDSYFFIDIYFWLDNQNAYYLAILIVNQAFVRGQIFDSKCCILAVYNFKIISFKRHLTVGFCPGHVLRIFYNSTLISLYNAWSLIACTCIAILNKTNFLLFKKSTALYLPCITNRYRPISYNRRNYIYTDKFYDIFGKDLQGSPSKNLFGQSIHSGCAISIHCRILFWNLEGKKYIDSHYDDIHAINARTTIIFGSFKFFKLEVKHMFYIPRVIFSFHKQTALENRIINI